MPCTNLMLAFTLADPPYGLFDEKKKELDFQGIYLLTADGKLQLLNKELSRPNGLAFSPDEKTLYVANSDPEKKLWMAYDVAANGTLSKGRVFFDVNGRERRRLAGRPESGHARQCLRTGPGGVWIFSADGKHLGTIKPTEVPANCHWGDADGKTLYMTARKGLYRVRLNIAGIRP